MITLATIAAPGATPIVNNGTSEQTFCDDYAKLDVGNISDRDRNTIAILGLIYKLNNAGGANYKSAHASLIQDAAVYTSGISIFNHVTARAVNNWNSGVVADATLSADVPTLLKEGRDIANLAADQQERIISFLRAQMRT